MSQTAADSCNSFDIGLIGFLNEIAGQKIGQHAARHQDDHCNKPDQTEHRMQHEQHTKEDW
ncbi:hypothetical protein D9M68_825250 [compost metagenome]